MYGPTSERLLLPMRSLQLQWAAMLAQALTCCSCHSIQTRVHCHCIEHLSAEALTGTRRPLSAGIYSEGAAMTGFGHRRRPLRILESALDRTLSEWAEIAVLHGCLAPTAARNRSHVPSRRSEAWSCENREPCVSEAK